MKKLITLAMSVALAVGSASYAFAGQQDPPKQEKKKSDKKGDAGKDTDQKGKDAGKKSSQ